MKTYLPIAFLFLLAAPALAPAFAQDTGAVFAALDADHDGKVSRAEAQKNPAVLAVFDQADKNHDGYLSRAEFDAAFGKQPGGAAR